MRTTGVQVTVPPPKPPHPLTRECVNSGAWSFLSAMVMVAVAVPVRPTSLPAMSLATISSSYVVVGSVWKTQTRG